MIASLGLSSLRALADSAEQLIEGSGLWFGIVHLVTGAQDCYGGYSNAPLKGIEEGGNREAISSSRRLRLYISLVL
jgi:hypothetical protein